MPYHTYENPLFGRTCFGLAHLAIPLSIYELYQLGIGYKLLTLLTISVLYEILGGLGITCGAHRLWSHRSYDAHIIFRSILMIFNCIAFQGELFYWIRDHRAHHKYSDTDADPHDMTKGFWFSHFGWLLVERSTACKKALKTIPMKDISRDAVIQFQMQYYLPLCILFRGIIPFLIGYMITGNAKIGIFYNICQMWAHSLHHTFFVNSASHTKAWGRRPYDPNILPCDNLFTIYCALGEGHHNWHHCFAQDYATSEKGWKQTFNPSKRFIDLFAKYGLVTNRKRWVKRDQKNTCTLAKNYVKTVIKKDCKDKDP